MILKRIVMRMSGSESALTDGACLGRIIEQFPSSLPGARFSCFLTHETEEETSPVRIRSRAFIAALAGNPIKAG
jgi:hypothetical protein